MTSLVPVRTLQALVVADDSSPQSALSQALQRNADISVIARTSSGGEAVALARHAGTDVVVIDLGLVDGSSQDTIESIMSVCPRPILVLAPGGDARSAQLGQALAAGAVQGLDRPVAWSAETGAALRHAVHQVSKVHVVRHSRRATAPPVRDVAAVGSRRSPVVAIAASTGGPSALAILLAGLGGLRAPVLVVQHMHADFTDGLLAWMSRVAALPVSAAVHGQLARPGHIYFGPTGRHLLLGAGGMLELSATPETIHRPSGDQLFRSVAERAGRAGIGVVMTGMGEDGAQGLLALHRQGGRTLGQDETSCAVFGMPQAARRVGAVTDLRPLTALAAAIQRAVSEVLA